MTNVRLIGAVVLSVLLIGPAMAARHSEQPRSRRQLSVEDALHFGYSAGICGYHSGYGGLYGDGHYPDNVCTDGGDHLID
jgi:ABC-type Mn2+/Zn2+ transport system permease subunit